MRQPSVSVVMATYNGERFLRQQLDSILGQSYPPLEIVIQDDGSTDRTMDILQEYAAKDGRIQLHVNTGAHGVSNNFYSAMRLARGELIAVSDQDDIWLPDKIATEVQAMGDNVLCGGISVPFADDGSFVWTDTRTPNHGLLRLIFSAEIPGHTMLIRRQWLDSLPWESHLVRERMYDYVLSLAAAAADSIAWVERPLVRHRQHASSATFTAMDSSVPNAANAFHMLAWCLKNYKKATERSRHRYHSIAQFLDDLHCTGNPACRVAQRMLAYRQSASLCDLLKFQWLCLRHWKEILHTGEPNGKNLLHAFLFPVLSCWYDRRLLEQG